MKIKKQLRTKFENEMDFKREKTPKGDHYTISRCYY